MSQDINYYLRDLVDRSKISKLLSDDETDISLILDLYTTQYRGARISFRHKGQDVYIDTEERKIVTNNGKRKTRVLDAVSSLTLDSEILRLFNIYKLDEDYFEEIKENIADELKAKYNQETKDLEDYLKNYLSDIKNNDYDEKLIGSLINKSKFNQKDDHFVIVRTINSSTIKYNSAKRRFVIKNNYNYKNKFSPDDACEGFDIGKFNEVVEKLARKKALAEKRLDLDDGLVDFAGFDPSYNFAPDVDMDN